MITINVLEELNRVSVAYEYIDEEQVRVLCPFHQDTKASCDIHLGKQKFMCRVCQTSGDVFTFIAKVIGVSRSDLMLDFYQRYGEPDDKTVSPDTIEKYHKRIWNAKPLLKALHDRCVTDDLIRYYRIGEDRGRVTIPITNGAGLFVNVRRYAPGHGTLKMLNNKGRGKIRLFPIEQLRYDKIFITGGEIKAIAATSQLNKVGIGCICATGGEGNWDHTFSSLFDGKEVYVCMDIDNAGREAASRVCASVLQHTPSVFLVTLPLDADKYPNGDVNDFLAQQGSLVEACESAPIWEPPAKLKTYGGEYEEADVDEIVNKSIVNKRVRIKTHVLATDQDNYLAPKSIRVSCSKDQNQCSVCPILSMQSDLVEVEKESPCLLAMIDSNKKTHHDEIRESLGIPSCKVVQFDAESYYRLTETRISREVLLSDTSTDKIVMPAVCVDYGPEPNETYNMIGRVHPHPKTQRSTLLVSDTSPTADALSTFSLEDTGDLRIFQPPEWTVEGIETILDRIYTDLEANVTRINKRRRLHIATDLVYHSPLLLNIDGVEVKGWAELLVVGDSATGKSSTVQALRKHYGVGESFECKNATVAGVLGGLQQINGRWFASWGVVPTHDRRLVIFEELKGMPGNVFVKLTDMRSSGIAEITKIQRRKTQARTRIIALSNPIDDRQLKEYNFGVSAIKHLVKNPEDVRRFDLCLVVDERSVSAEDLSIRLKSEHIYNSDLCRKLILHAWTVKDIHFEDEQYLFKKAMELCDEFSESIPLIDRGSTRFKLARLAAGLAARTFSSSGRDLYVRNCHVDFVTQFIRAEYTDPYHGYALYSQAERNANQIDNVDEVFAQLASTPYPMLLSKRLLDCHEIEVQDICDWSNFDRQEANNIISCLVRNNALTRKKRHYVKTPPFIDILREWLDKDKFPQRPAHIPSTGDF